MQFDKDKSEIGLLYGMISKVRAMLLLKENGTRRLGEGGRGLRAVQVTD